MKILVILSIVNLRKKGEFVKVFYWKMLCQGQKTSGKHQINRGKERKMKIIEFKANNYDEHLRKSLVK